MVVGVLALIAIVAVLYGALGQADRRGSAAYTRATALDDHAQTIADYLAGIIGRDVFSTYTEEYSTVGSRRTLRSLRDYPSIDPSRQCVFDPAIFSSAAGVATVEANRFRPAGGDNDPWLAPTDPSYLGDGYTPASVVASRPYLRYRDWLHISVFSPDGRFVNLANLRNNFTCPPGIPTLFGGPARTMSSGLTLFDAAGLAYAVSNPSNPTDPNIRLPDGSQADLNNPAHWAGNQQHAFRPARQVDRRPGAPGPATFEYLLNQWCDADGDGLVDSRWFEPVDATNPSQVVPILPSDSRFRFFLAARAVDLSACINVNTASDLVEIPNEEYPLGFTPADIDLRRALTLGNVYEHFFFGQELLAYNRLFERSISTPPPTSYYRNYWYPAAALVGRAGYAALASTLESGFMPLPTTIFTDFNYTREQRAQRYDLYGSSSAAGTFSNLRFVSRAPFGLAELAELLTYDRVNDPRRTSRLESAVGGRSSATPVPPLPPRNTYASYDPLRSNRDLSLERDGRGLGGPNDFFPMAPPGAATGLASNMDLLAAIGDLRHRLTTVNGARPLTAVASPTASQALASNPKAELAAWDLKVNARELLSQVAGQLTFFPPGVEPVARRTARKALTDLFRAYLDAVMPYRQRTVAGPIGGGSAFDPWDSASFPAGRALHYARSAELAYRMAAHLLVNTIDALDDEWTTAGAELPPEVSGPTAVSLRVSGDLDPRPYWEENSPPSPAPIYVPGATPGGSALFPYDPLDPREVVRLPSGADEVRLHNDEIAISTTPGLRAGKVNIFGIEAQPFFSEVSSFVAFWDAPPPRGDNEAAGGFNEITINRGSMSTSSSDFLFEAIAFQITNPFDRDISIVPQDGDFRYYIEYAGQYFQLAHLDSNGTGILATPITLEAGETRVFYATNPPTQAEVNSRMSSGAGFTLSAWASRQFGVDNNRDGVIGAGEEPVHIPMISGPPTAGGFMTATWVSSLPGDLHGRNLPVSSDDRKIVYLWRFVRAPGSGEVPDFATVTNLQGNDLLVDRIRVPASSSGTGGPAELAIPEVGGNDPVTGTDVNDDDTGYSLVAYSYVRRPTNFADAGQLPPPLPPAPQPSPRGALPPWCLESRSDAASGYATSLNAGEMEYDNPATLTAADFAPGAQQRFRTLDDLVANHLASPIENGMSTPPERKTDHQLDMGGRMCQSFKPDPALPGARMQKKFRDVAVQVKLGGRAKVRDASGGTVYERLNPALFTRVADLLLPLAIGPVHEPNPGGSGVPRAQQLEDEWMTLGEALALAMDYYSPQDTLDMYYMFGHDDPLGEMGAFPPGPRRPLADRGNLVLDDFVPFLDMGPFPAPPALPTFDPAAGDRPLGSGIPLALNIIDKFRTDNYGSLTSVVPGKLNINTAPTANLQLLPGLAPDPRPTGDPNEAWWTIDHVLNAADPVPRDKVYDPTTDPFDAATTLSAYRDKTAQIPRPPYTLPTSFFTPSGIIDFRDANDNPTGLVDVDGRRNLTGISGMREERGFGSLGEMLAARFADPDLIPAAVTQPHPSSGIDYLGRDIDPTSPGGGGPAPRAIVGHPGLDAGVYREVFDVNGTNEVRAVNDEIPNDYDEKLAIATAAMNTTTVRSDIFAVWFVVHGYQPSDVEIADPNTPIVPTIARRYLMVVDRSNVVRPGDKPRILMLQEVPL
jgi:hypothetical protein